METLARLLQQILDALRQRDTFDTTRQSLTTRLTITLAPGELRQVYQSFRSLTVLTISGGATGVFITLNAQGTGATPSEIFAGLVLKTPGNNIFVENFNLENTTGAPVTVDLMLGFMDVDDNRLNVAGSVFVQNAAGTGIRTFSGTTAQHFAATVGTTAAIASGTTATRRRITIKANKSNTDDIYVGTNGVTNTGNAFPLSPGESISLDTQVTIWLVSGTAGQNARILTESD